MEVPVLSHHLTRRVLVPAVAAVAAALTLSAPPASAAIGPGASASVQTRVDDPNDLLGRLGNVHLVQVGVIHNPEGDVVGGEITSYTCDPGQPLGQCDRVSLTRLVGAGPVTIKVRGDGSATLSATVAEVRERDGKQLRVFDVNLTVGPGTLELRRNCTCGFTAADGTSYTQRQFVKQWYDNTASGTVGKIPVTAGAATVASTGKFTVKTSVPV
jgi:hypothetical protein